MKKRILIINSHYYPGFRSGGPQQTVKNICDVYCKESDIYLLTQNCDMGSEIPYDIETRKWLTRDNINIMYVEPKFFNFKLLRKMYFEFDNIYLCGGFAAYTLKMLLINRFYQRENINLYLAPMGIFSKGALTLRIFKKSVFLKIAKLINLYKNVIWSFTSIGEYHEALNSLNANCVKNYLLAEDLPRSFSVENQKKKIQQSVKNINNLRVVFLSRLSAKKNLLGALQILNYDFKGYIIFDIYGSLEDKQYWQKCENIIKDMPTNIRVSYKGEIKPDESINVFSNYDVFLFPTLGENFGHVVFEALAAGCIPVISDTTPWLDFKEKRCGSVVGINDTESFRKELQYYLGLANNNILSIKENAINYAFQKYISSVSNSGYGKIFCSK